ncbi:acetyl-CoA C-acetyltransferase [Breoghania corrubedonensis]|uniref:Acetyl-CoA C-acetyltransferase n=1 Tax=Breoghania corrubedonensis TaxID=665038 RepID=A0A2T5V4L5_9HYPH|nr:thiolase family protein [Breoghania corrubedonensis]PTW58707.1 acetyl-CoA C-acetyltransferase [Breoghania corrubedonensis]
MSFLAAALRTAVVPRGGGFKALRPHELAAPVVTALLRQAGLEGGDVDQLILSNALGGGGNPARVTALAAGLAHVSGLSIDAQCAGGLDAIALASAMIDAGQARIVIAGGAESFSLRPLRAHTFADGREPEFYTRPPFSPFPDQDPDMADAADELARQYAITRDEQDAYAVESHARALAARDRLVREIVPLEGVERDTFTRALSPKLAARTPAVSGSVSVAATAVEADAAAFCLVVSADVLRAMPHLRGVEIAGYASAGGESSMPGIAPVRAVNRVLEGQGLGVGDLAVVELMEAYAAQAMACIRGADLPDERVNLGGGALARGHPIGASGAILACRLYHEPGISGGTGLCAIAAAGGIGSALLMRG